MTTKTEEREISFGSGIRGVINGVGKLGPVIISHAAGSGLQTKILAKTAVKLADCGFTVLRFDFTYLGKGAPSLGGKKEIPETAQAVEFMKQYGEPIIIGKSFGGRVASYLAATRSDIRALVFYGLPLQGMSKTSKPRDWSHLTKITAPMLFITGDKDKLCPLDQLESVQKPIRVAFESKVIPGDHSFKPKSEDLAVEICVDWVNRL